MARESLSCLLLITHATSSRLLGGRGGTNVLLQMKSISGKALCISAGWCKPTYHSHHSSMTSAQQSLAAEIARLPAATLRGRGAFSETENTLRMTGELEKTIHNQKQKLQKHTTAMLKFSQTGLRKMKMALHGEHTPGRAQSVAGLDIKMSSFSGYNSYLCKKQWKAFY